MGDLWLPSAIPFPGRRSGGTIRQPDAPARGVVHTTETPAGTGRTVATNLEWPYHVIVDPARREVLQLIPFNRSAYALKGVSGRETNHMGICAQICLVGRADDMHALTAGQLDWLTDEVFAPASALCGIPVGKFRPFVAPHQANYIMASTSSPIRLTWPDWERFHGWCGHQHVPGQDHYDPGGVDWRRVAARATPPPEPQEQPVTILGAHDSVTAGPNSLTVTGWAGSTSGAPVAVVASIDGQGQRLPRVPRGDVVAAHPALAQPAGYEATLDVPAGVRRLKVEVLGTSGGLVLFDADVDVPPAPAPVDDTADRIGDLIAAIAANVAELQRLIGR